MQRKRGSYIVDSEAATQIISTCERSGWRIFRLPTDIASKDQFFDGVLMTLPLDPPGGCKTSWDALDDSVWSGLHGLKEGKILVAWPNASLMKSQTPNDFAIASYILAELVESLSDVKATVDVPKELIVLQIM